MKIRIIGLENEIDLNSDDVVNVIIIKDVNYFSNIIKIINDSMNGIETNEVFLLGDEEEELKINKECYLLLDLFNIDYNSKKVLTKIYDYIEDNVKNNQDYEVERLVLKIRNYLIQEINELPFEFTMKSELEITEILKLFSLKIDDENYQTI
ncbi:MAG: type II-A CRISPR-associated protein Csn2, partial [Clostridia bacterium]|nr:type II-A CRISPR-associated protein Csn2 [Clostridia bacterium]